MFVKLVIAFCCQHEPAIEGRMDGYSMYEEFVCDIVPQIIGTLACTKWQVVVSFGSFFYFFQFCF